MNEIELFCLVEGDSAVFPVTVDIKNHISRLKELIHDKGINSAKYSVLANLTLWKLKEPLLIAPLRTLAERLSSRGANVSEFAVELEESTFKVSDCFPEVPLEGCLYLIVQLPPAAASPPRIRRSTPDLPRNVSLRSDTVSALCRKLNLYRFIQVRGTPASGKTLLAQLLIQHIRQQKSAMNVIWVQGWSRDQVTKSGGWQNYLEAEKGWVKNEKTLFVFDEAQLSYWDGELWNNLFKSIGLYDERLAILFSSYGSPNSHVIIDGTPIFIEDAQRITLRSIQHQDNLPPVGLLFTRTEFNDLVSKLYPPPAYRFHTSFFDALFEVTDGHVGAIIDFMKIIVTHDSYRAVRNITDQSYTWNLFLKEVSPRVLVTRLESSASTFARGLPPNTNLRYPAVARVFSAVLREGVVKHSTFTSNDEEMALFQCFHNGWLHTDKLGEVDALDEFGYFFPSPLHRWYVEWKLWDNLPETSFNTPNILEFVINVIHMFSRRLLSTERRLGTSCIQGLLEAQYQDEFYRCCHTCSNGSLVTFPEFGTAKGRVDFYIPAKQWGVELLRDGDRLGQHSGRFSKAGSYGTTLDLSDYIILDCRTTSTTVAHPHLPKLHHVVFSDSFHHVRILDNRLKLVPHGEFDLLASS